MDALKLVINYLVEQLKSLWTRVRPHLPVPQEPITFEYAKNKLIELLTMIVDRARANLSTLAKRLLNIIEGWSLRLK